MIASPTPPFQEIHFTIQKFHIKDCNCCRSCRYVGMAISDVILSKQSEIVSSDLVHSLDTEQYDWSVWFSFTMMYFFHSERMNNSGFHDVLYIDLWN